VCLLEEYTYENPDRRNLGVCDYRIGH